MKLESFKEKNNKKVGIIIFTIGCVLLIAGVIFYNSFALFETKDEFNLINGVVEEPGDIYFSYYINDEISLNLPSKDSGYTLSNKSHCTNKVEINWDDTTWTLSLNYSNYQKEKSSKTKCDLYFEEAPAGSPLRVVNATTNDGMWKYRSSITKIEIQNELKPVANSIQEFDESEGKD